MQLGQSTFYEDLQRAHNWHDFFKGPTLLILTTCKMEHLEAFDIVRDDSRLL